MAGPVACVPHIADLEPTRRTAILIVQAASLEARATDATLAMFEKYIGTLFSRARNRDERRLQATRRDVARALVLFRRTIAALRFPGRLFAVRSAVTRSCSIAREIGIPLGDRPELLSDVAALTISPSDLLLPEVGAHPFDPSRPLDMDEVTMFAVINNPDLKAARDQVGVAGRTRREHQPAALGSKRFGGRQADTAARAGDQGDFAYQLQIHRVCSIIRGAAFSAVAPC